MPVDEGASVTPAAVDAGAVRITLGVRDEVVADVRIASRRPDVTAVFCGRTIAEALPLVPLVFAVCGRAQGRAAALAVAAAQGVETAPCLDAQVEREVIREHLWRLLLDLPPLLGLDPEPGLFRTAQSALAADDRDGVQAVLAAEFWNRLMGALAGLDAAMEVDAGATALLPVLSARQSFQHWPVLDRDFATSPSWQLDAAETGAHARWQGQNPASAGPLAARWHARCAEVWSWAGGGSKVGAGGTVSAARLPGDAACGRALVDTARGLLMHEVELSGDRIARHVIVAPTEWNFHPRGRLFDWLHRRPWAGEAELHGFVAHAVAALDPCVRWELVIQ